MRRGSAVESAGHLRIEPDSTRTPETVVLAQFQPGTWHDVCVKNELVGRKAYRRATLPSVLDPKYAILAMGYYLRSLWLEWTTPRPVFDRMQLTHGASYNAGQGSRRAAYRSAGGA